MSLSLGSDVKRIYLGGEAKEAWLDGVKVWEAKKTNPTINIGGKDYQIKKIGNLYWTTENLNYKCVPETSTNSPSATYMRFYSYGEYYDDVFGLYYNNMALNTIQTKLPSGWRIPTTNDFENLISITGGGEENINKLLSKDPIMWYKPGTDDFEFNAIGSGYCSSGVGYYKRDLCCFWTKFRKYNSTTSYSFGNKFISINENDGWEHYYSIRLCKDA